MRQRLITVAVAALASACGAGDRADTGWAGTMDTLASGAVVVHNPAEGIRDEGEAWRLTEELRIGTAMGTGPGLFGRVADLAVDRIGRIWVLDGEADELRVFGPDGTHIRTIGRTGAGPGEFEGPQGLAWGPEGNIWVADLRNGRYSVFSTSGTYLTSYRRDTGIFMRPWPGVIDSSGRLYDIGYRAVDGEFVDAVILFDSAIQPVDTFPLPRWEDENNYFHHVAAGGRMRMAAEIPFMPQGDWLLDPAGYVWFGLGYEYRIFKRSPDGDTVRIIERAYDPVPVTAAELDVALEDLESFIDRSGEVDMSRIPNSKPAYQRIHLGSEAFLWVVPSVPADVTGTVFDVFDPEGRYLGRVRSPTPISGTPPPLFLSDAIYAVTRGQLDVPFIVRIGINGRER